MSKRIEVKSERWAGSVTIADPLTMSQARSVEAGLGKPPDTAYADNGRVWLSVIDEMRLPAIFACVENWELANMPEKLTADNFPASPRGESNALINEIFQAIAKVYFGEALVPNG